MQIDWSLNVGTIFGVVLPILIAIWLAALALYLKVEKLGGAVTELQTDLSELKTQHTATARRQAEQRQEMQNLGMRLTRIETLLEVMLPGVMQSPALRAIFKDAARVAARGWMEETESAAEAQES